MTDEGRMGGLPNGYEPVPHQVAGHMHKDGKAGMLRPCGESGGKLLKPVQRPPKGQREVDFYRFLNAKASSMPVWKEFQKWTPHFNGVVELSDKQQYIVLEDLAARYDAPSVMDIKVGKQCWDKYASEEKIRTEMAKYPPQATLGFRIGGTRRYVETTEAYEVKSKTECLGLSSDGVFSTLKHFFRGHDDDLREMVKQLRCLLQLFESQTHVHFYSSSLLFLFGGPSDTVQHRRPCVHMIDFAHAYILEEEEACIDDNYLFGLRNVIDSLSMLL